MVCDFAFSASLADHASCIATFAKDGSTFFGLFSFLVANVAAFSVATQAYGDLFILLILSWTLGFLLAVPVLLEREVRARQPAIFEELAPVFRPKTV